MFSSILYRFAKFRIRAGKNGNGLKQIIILNMSHLIINSPNKIKFALVSDQAQVKLEWYTFIIIGNSVISNDKTNLLLLQKAKKRNKKLLLLLVRKQNLRSYFHVHYISKNMIQKTVFKFDYSNFPDINKIFKSINCGTFNVCVVLF